MKLPRLLLGSLVSLAAGGCQSLREQLPAANCPPTFDDGFEAGCSSGRSRRGHSDISARIYRATSTSLCMRRGGMVAFSNANVSRASMVGKSTEMSSGAIKSGASISTRRRPERCVVGNFFFSLSRACE